MIVTIDGYDGTGKTTLAKRLAERYGFIYLDKPFIGKYQCENKCSLEEAQKRVKEIEKKLFSSASKAEITKFYCEALIWLTQFKNEFNIILDRGLLTTYAVVGEKETEEVFKKYIEYGAFLDASIYLVAADEERVRRIYANDPNDPDLKYPVKWRENNLEEFASSMNLNYHKIDTNNKTPEQVFEQASIFFEQEIKRVENIDSNRKDFLKRRQWKRSN